MSKELKFNNGKFTIMTLGDLHESMVLDTREKRKRREDMHNLVKISLMTFKPDLVVLLGDTLNKKDDSEDFSLYKKALREILKPILDSGIPFCYVLGNHEHDTCQEEQIVEAYAEFENCCGKNDTDSPRGNFNCNILVKNSAGTEDILNLWFIDSNNRCPDEKLSVYDWVHEDQIKWYEQKVRRIKAEHGGKTIPAIVFQHIPVIEEYELLREAKVHEKVFKAVDGHGVFSDKKYMMKNGVDGYLGEGPATPCVNSGQFQSWKKTGDVIAAFFGHDHLNDFTGYVDGIMLGQNKTSGFCCYTDGCRSAVRITTVDENNIQKLESKIYHFKDLGLEATSLGPIEKRITDRQSMTLHKLGRVATGVAGIAVVGTLIKKAVKH